MKEIIIDARGLACPGPVIRTKAAMAEGATQIVTIVDNETAVTNVTRMAEKASWQVKVDRRPDGTYVHLYRRETEPVWSDPISPTTKVAGPTVLFVKSDRMGIGDDELGSILIRAFFHTLLELEDSPAIIIFVNTGVKLAVEGSPILEDLKELECRGVEILACGTCLKYFELTEKLAAGSVSNMYTIVETLISAGHIISP